MTALLAPGATVSTDEELIRQLHDRIRKLETSTSPKVGQWSLFADPLTGALKAATPDKVVNLSEPAAAAEVDLSSLTAGLVSEKDLAASNANLIATLTGGGGSLGDLEDWLALIPQLVDGFLPVDLISGLGTAFLGFQQPLIDLIVNAIEGTPGFVGNAVELVFTGINGLKEGLAAAHEVADSLAFYFQDMSSLLVQIVQQATVRPVLGVIDAVMDAVSFWIFGWFHRTEQAHTAQNAGIATLRGEVNAKFAEIAAGTTGWVDNFDAVGYSLATNYTTATGESSSVLTTRGSNIVLAPPVGSRATMKYNTEMSTGKVDIEMAISNLAVRGRAALWIGATSGSVAGGLASGTMLVRIDNGIADSTKQRLQIYTVSGAGTLAAHGTLYSEDFGTWHDGDLIRLRKDETTQYYRVFLNDVEACHFDDDVTNIVNLGAGSRFAGWRQNSDAASTNVGPDLDLIHVYDWTA
jgi:hypothetical protein